MSKPGKGRLMEGSSECMQAATADLRRQYRKRNILLVIVGAEACILLLSRVWNAF